LGAIYSMRPPVPAKPSAAVQHAVEATRRQADAVRLSYGRLRQKGCAEAEISFAAAGLPGHQNPHARPQHACDIFDLAGGAIAYQPPSTQILDPSSAGSPGFGAWQYSLDNDIAGLGSQPCTDPEHLGACNDLIAVVPYFNETACRVANGLERSPIPLAPVIPAANPGGLVNLKGYAGEVSGQQIITGPFYGRMSGCFRLEKAWFGTGATPVVSFNHLTYAYFRVLAGR
jgi:hypothetical protein